MAGAVAVICVTLLIQTLTVDVVSTLSLDIWRESDKYLFTNPELTVNDDLLRQYTYKEGGSYTAYCSSGERALYWEAYPYALQGPKSMGYDMYLSFYPSRYDNHMTIACISSKTNAKRIIKFVWDGDESTPIKQRETAEDGELQNTFETTSKCLTANNSTTCAIFIRSQNYDKSYRLQIKTKKTQ